jgi:hypothetical protein
MSDVEGKPCSYALALLIQQNGILKLLEAK